MTIKKLTPLFLITAMVAFLGFCVENIWLIITRGYINNRNMLLPFIFGYGIAVVIIYLMFGTPTSVRFFALSIDTGKTLLNVLIYFSIVCLCVSVGECALGTLVEKTCGIVWWNYTNIPLNITKYTSIPTSLGFGAIITTFMHFFFKPISDRIAKANSKVLDIIAYILMALMLIDFLHTAYIMFTTQSFFKIWQIDFKAVFG